MAVKPNALPADPQAVDAARSAPPIQVDPVSPPPPPQPVDVATQAQLVAEHQGAEVRRDVSGREYREARPKHWDYVSYDDQHHPMLYNPTREDFVFHYYFDGGYRDVFVPAGGQVVLNLDVRAVFPYTAVSPSYVAVGSFYGGGVPPVVYNNVTAHVVSVNRDVAVNRVVLVGHDDNAPNGQQDIFMLNDSTLAHGQIVDGRNGGTVNIATTQDLPGVGPVENGANVVNAALTTPIRHGLPMRWIVTAVGVATAGILFVIGWFWRHPRGRALPWHGTRTARWTGR
ncbi:hypothetical protein MSP7336_00557 [Mycobacterium shimoidei]|uniref:Uncharacterized protein n=1 Tax=Mycobacterium shimoidei TaxID=29313 RepID=A0A375YU32_MYCSH|nr:hypothetical protein [Mycobacterium shimoidei]SRX92332.1 hypothetical protein MSP7336_00557 [Mycobacterium shimoidei]